MTLARFVSKNAFRNKRRSVLTVLSVAFSLLLLTLMMTIWRAFYLDEGSAESAQRLVVRHRVSLTFSLPAFAARCSCGGSRLLVWRNLQRSEAGELFCSVRHRPRGIFQSVPGCCNTGGSGCSLAARPPGSDRGRHTR